MLSKFIVIIISVIASLMWFFFVVSKLGLLISVPLMMISFFLVVMLRESYKTFSDELFPFLKDVIKKRLKK